MHQRKRHRNRTKKNRMRGGSNMFGNNYEPVTDSGGSSGWSYMNKLVGGLDQQYNSLMGNGTGNTLSVRSQPMAGGRKRRHSRHRRRGGSFMPVVADAVVPLGLLAVQQTYGKRRKSKRTRRKY
jgi:hypothetical protein